MDSEGNPTQIPASALTLPGIGGMAAGSAYPGIGTSGNTPTQILVLITSILFVFEPSIVIKLMVLWHTRF